MNKTLDIYQKLSILKDEERVRRGWIHRKVPGRLESVAEHCFAMTNLAVLLNLEYHLNLDMEKVLTMINIHEYGEIEVGDIIPKDGISKEEKYQKEKQAIINVMGNHQGSQKILELWIEFESLETDEAIFVFLLDKFQSVLQSKEYADKYQRPDIYEQFLTWYNNSIIPKIERKNNNLTRILSIKNDTKVKKS